jgi:hypothetical protein
VSGEGWRRAAATLALAVVCYANTLGNELVWDDRLTAAAPAPITQRAGDYYRPVVMLSFRMDRWLFGGAPAGHHTTNLVAHAAVAWLVGTLAAALGASPGAALAASLLFAAHPVQTEAVSYVSGRTDVLAAGFALGAVLVWRRARTPLDRFAVATSALVVAALGCKESVALVPLVLLLVPGARPRPWVPLAAAAVWIVAWGASGGPGLRLAGLDERLPAIAASVLTYVRLLVWPSDLHLERFVAVPGWSGASAIAMWAGVLALIAVLAAAARVVPGGRVFAAFAAATYLPAAGIVPVYPAIADRALFAAEHFLYLPLCGLVPFAVGIGARLAPRRLAPVLVAALLVVCVPLAVARNRDWRDEETLFRKTLRYDPPAARVWYNLANLRLAAGDAAEAERLYREAAHRAPRDAAVRLNLGIALQRQGRRAEAETEYMEALRLDPSLARAFDRAR